LSGLSTWLFVPVFGCSLDTESVAATSAISASTGASSSVGNGTSYWFQLGSWPVSLSVVRVSRYCDLLPGAFSSISMVALRSNARVFRA
jgi:hypothetical protein